MTLIHIPSTAAHDRSSVGAGAARSRVLSASWRSRAARLGHDLDAAAAPHRNLDNKELVAGTTLYCRSWSTRHCSRSAMSHGAQGDGEVCITAIETGLIGTFELHARPDMTLEWPLAETPDAHDHHGVRSRSLTIAW